MMNARLFPPAVGDASQPIGSLLTTSIASILDLYRALVPVVQAEMMGLSPALRIRFANDCTYLAADVSQLATSFRDNEALFAKLADANERLVTVGEQWLDDCLVRISN
jgi:centromere/kinetochore protein ZW10